MNKFNLTELYQKVFGIKGIRFDLESGFNSSDNNKGKSGFEFSLPELTKSKALSYLGTPINEQIAFSVPGSNTTYTFPDWPLIDIYVAKNIVTTPIKGRNGSVKEYINTGDYQINIRGIFINYESDEYPEEMVYQFHELFKLNRELRVTNSLLNLLDVHDLVITDIRLPEVEGFNHIQPFIIQCISDRAVELTITEAKKQSRSLSKG